MLVQMYGNKKWKLVVMVTEGYNVWALTVPTALTFGSAIRHLNHTKLAPG